MFTVYKVLEPLEIEGYRVREQFVGISWSTLDLDRFEDCSDQRSILGFGLGNINLWLLFKHSYLSCSVFSVFFFMQCVFIFN